MDVNTCVTLVNGEDIYINSDSLTQNTQRFLDQREEKRFNPTSRLISPLTERWLTENYCVSEGASVPRNVLYEHYLDFCVRNSMQPVNAASFGKIIRQHFPNLRTRRLGSRGQSKYHYYGLAIKDSSQYHLNEYSVQATPTKHSTVNKIVRPNIISPVKPVPSDVLASLLPDYPKPETLNLPSDVARAHIRRYLDAYRAHSQNVLEVIVKAAFSEVEPLLLDLWDNLPDDVISSLDRYSDLVGYCDLLLYKTIISLLLPTPLHPIPSSLTQTIRTFCKQFGGWIRISVAGLPDNVVRSKLQVADIFVSMMRRQTTLTHIAQATRTVLSSSSAVSQMIHDWCHLDIDSMTHQSLFLFSSSPHPTSAKLKEVQMEFSELLGEQASVEEYAEWIKELVDNFVIKKSTADTFKTNAHHFLTQWSYFISRTVRDLTLRSAPSFGSFHLLHMLFSDYVLHLLEEHQHSDLQSKLWESLSTGSANNRGDMLHTTLLRHPTSTISNNIGELSPLLPPPTGHVTCSTADMLLPLRHPNLVIPPPPCGHEETDIIVTDEIVDVMKEHVMQIDTQGEMMDITVPSVGPALNVNSTVQEMMQGTHMSLCMSDNIHTDNIHTDNIHTEHHNIHTDNSGMLGDQTGLLVPRSHTDINIETNLLSGSLLTTEDLIPGNDGDCLPDTLMDEILKCVSNSNL